MLINTNTRIKLLSNRTDENNAVRFFTSFKKFVLDTYIGSPNSTYKDYIIDRCKSVGFYSFVKNNADMYNNADLLIEKNKELLFSIHSSGINNDIVISYEKGYGIEIDGYHRLTIANVLGIQEVPCTIKERVLLIMAHPDDELLFGWPILLDTSVNKEVLICSNDYCNKNRPNMYARKEALQWLCTAIGVKGHSLNFESEFYKRKVRNRDLLQFESLISSFISEANIIFTHNCIGEYGHLDHKLINNICMNSDKHIIFTDIVDTADWSENTGISKNYVNLYTNQLCQCTLDLTKFNELKKIYTDKHVWTWFKDPISKCNLYII